MARMLLESVKYARQDMQAKALLEAINEAKSILLATDRFIQQNAANLSQEETGVLRAKSKFIEDQLGTGDKDRIIQGIEDLNQYSAPIAHRMLDLNIGQALHGTKAI